MNDWGGGGGSFSGIFRAWLLPKSGSAGPFCYYLHTCLLIKALFLLILFPITPIISSVVLLYYHSWITWESCTTQLLILKLSWGCTCWHSMSFRVFVLFNIFLSEVLLIQCCFLVHTLSLALMVTISLILFWQYSFEFWRLNLKYSACMVGCPHPLRPLIIYAILTVFKKFLMRGPCVIFYGRTQMIAAVGVSPLGVLDILLARFLIFLSFFPILFSFIVIFQNCFVGSGYFHRTYLSNLITQTTWSWLQELTNWLWRDSTGVM